MIKSDKRSAADVLAFLWCNRRPMDAALFVKMGEQLWGVEWWKPYFGPELQPGILKMLDQAHGTRRDYSSSERGSATS